MFVDLCSVVGMKVFVNLFHFALNVAKFTAKKLMGIKRKKCVRTQIICFVSYHQKSDQGLVTSDQRSVTSDQRPPTSDHRPVTSDQ